MSAVLLLLLSTASAGGTSSPDASQEASLQETASEEWAALKALGDRATDASLEDFVQRYQSAGVPEVAEAAALLEERNDTGGRTGVSSEDLSSLMISSRGVKSCWVVYQQETGQAPSGRILVSITIQPDGVPSDAHISGGTYQGSTLDRCLSTAIRRTKFPPFEGMATTIEYPFVL